MANQIQITNLNPNNFVGPTSRYLSSQVIYYGPNNFITFTQYVRKPKAFSPNDKFMIITKGFEYRPDLVANRAYGIPGLWWKIMEANDIFDILDFKVGTNIRIPEVIT